MSIFKELAEQARPILEKVRLDCGEDYQPKNPLYALESMDSLVNKGINPVCVLLGQDPYPQKNVATGLAFANRPSDGHPYISPSLRIIEASILRLSIKEERLGFFMFDPTLNHWKDQGILLLNSSLTVRTGCSGSHTMLWAPTMINIVSTISRTYPKLCWIMFGSQARNFIPCLSKESYVLCEYHPSYYARNKIGMPESVWEEARNYCKRTFDKEIHWYYR